MMREVWVGTREVEHGFHSPQVCSESSKLTHSHISGVNGALVQAMAVKLALQSDGAIDTQKFVDKLLQQIQPFEDLSTATTKDQDSQDSQM